MKPLATDPRDVIGDGRHTALRHISTPPRVHLFRDGSGWGYAIRADGRVTAEGWTAGDRADAMRMATARCEEYEKTGLWSLDLEEGSV